MGHRLRRHAERRGPNEIVLTLSTVLAINQLSESWLEPSFWTLERLEDGAWRETDASLLSTARIEAVATGDDLAEIRFRFERLDGVYRLSGLSGSGATDLEYDWNVSYFRQYAADHEPYHLELEGCLFGTGGTVLPYYLLDQESLPGSLSEKVDVQTGRVRQSGLTLTLVDLPNEGDGRLTDLFAPRRTGRTALLINGLSSTDTELGLSDPLAFEPGEIVFVGREAVRLGVREVDGFSSCTRGLVHTVRSVHDKAAVVRDWNPVWAGRRLWVKDAAGRVLYAGVVERIEPAENLACYKLTLHSALESLDTAIGQGRLAVTGLAGRFYVEPDHNRLFLLVSADGYDAGAATSEVLTAELEPGFYDITPGAQQRGRYHLAGALYRALGALRVSVGSCSVTGVAIDERGVLRLSFSAQVRRLALYDDAEEAGDGRVRTGGGLLSQLGFASTSTESVSVSALDAPVRHDFAADEPLTAGVWEKQTVLALRESSTVGDAVTPVAGLGNIVRVGKELIGYGEWVAELGTDVSVALSESVSASTSTLVFDEARFRERDLVHVGSESVLLGQSRDRLTFTDCVRGAEDTTAQPHTAGVAATRIPRPRLIGCRRGLFGTRAAFHKAGESVVQVLAGGAPETSRSQAVYWPMTTFLSRLLWEEPGVGPALETAWIDRTSLFVALATVNGATDGSFFGVADGEGTYREWLDALLPSLDLFIVSDGQGRIAFRRMEPLLPHQSAPNLTMDNMVRPPSVGWEHQTLSLVRMDLDREPGSDTYLTRLLFRKDEEEALRVFGHSDNKVERKAGGLYSAASSRDGAAETSLYRVARQMMARHKTILMNLAVEVPLYALGAEHLPEVLSALRVSCPHVPRGDGTRGLNEQTFWVVERDMDLSRGLLRLGLLEQADTRLAGLSVGLVVEQVTERTVHVRAEGLWPNRRQADPASLFAPECVVRFIAASGVASGSLIASAPCSILAASFPDTWPDGTGTLTLGTLPSPAPQAGDWLIAARFDEAGLPLRHLAHLADENETLGEDNQPAQCYW